MKTFTATHLNKHAQEVFAAAKDAPVVIEHSNYFGGTFAIVWHPDISMEDVIKAGELMDSLDVNKDAC